MVEENIDFALSCGVLENIPFMKYEKNITFIVNGKRHQTSRFIADLLSPIIREYHFTDETIDKFVINTNNEKANESATTDYFEDFLNLCSFKEIKLDTAHQKYFSEYFYLLGNTEEYFRLRRDYFSEVTTDNAIDRLNTIIKISKQISPKGTVHPVNIDEIIKFIAQNFYMIDQNSLKQLDLFYIESIISSPCLQIENEDTLMNFVSILYEEDPTYSVLFDYVIFYNLSEETIGKFIEEFDIEHLDKNIWKSICSRLIPSKYPQKQNEARYTARIEAFQYEEGREFEGILNYLSDETHGNIIDNGTIEITTNSEDNGCSVKRIIDYQKPKEYYQSNDDIRAVIRFDFKDKMVQLDGYSLKTGSDNSNGRHLKSWCMEGSHDGEKWDEIDHRENDSSLRNQYKVSTFMNNKKKNEFYKCIRLCQTGPSWLNNNDSNNQVEISLVEFYGQLKTLSTH